jgi:hypothetical protein
LKCSGTISKTLETSKVVILKCQLITLKALAYAKINLEVIALKQIELKAKAQNVFV